MSKKVKFVRDFSSFVNNQKVELQDEEARLAVNGGYAVYMDESEDKEQKKKEKMQKENQDNKQDKKKGSENKSFGDKIKEKVTGK